MRSRLFAEKSEEVHWKFVRTLELLWFTEN